MELEILCNFFCLRGSQGSSVADDMVVSQNQILFLNYGIG